MKKLFALLVMLTVSIGSWAYKHNFPDFGVSFDDTPPAQGNTQFINITTPGGLATWSNSNPHPPFKIPDHVTNLVIIGVSVCYPFIGVVYFGADICWHIRTGGNGIDNSLNSIYEYKY